MIPWHLIVDGGCYYPLTLNIGTTIWLSMN